MSQVDVPCHSRSLGWKFDLLRSDDRLVLAQPRASIGRPAFIVEAALVRAVAFVHADSVSGRPHDSVMIRRHRHHEGGSEHELWVGVSIWVPRSRALRRLSSLSRI